MAYRKEEKGEKENQALGRTDGKDMSESSPNPRRESNILEMPIRTQQRNEATGKNIPRVPNTIGGNLNPSVAHDFEARVLSNKNAAARRARALKPVKEKDT